MNKFGKASLENLKLVDPRLVDILNEAIKVIDFSVIEGHRGEEKQNKAFNEGKSKKKFPDSKHNTIPSKAVDIVPYPVDWNDTERFCILAGIVLGIAHTKNIKIRWGADWNKNNKTSDESFKDYPHFELME